jgi:hypothetical protein
METYFHNVTIAISARTSKAAYTKLCNALATIDSVDWDTDTYTTEKHPEERSTVRLFPNFGKKEG